MLLCKSRFPSRSLVCWGSQLKHLRQRYKPLFLAHTKVLWHNNMLLFARHLKLTYLHLLATSCGHVSPSAGPHN